MEKWIICSKKPKFSESGSNEPCATCFTELEHLSLKLQEKKTTLPEAHHLVLVKYHVLQSMANNPGEYYSEVLMAADKLEFKGVSLEHGKVQKISEQQFFQKLSDNINTRMFTTRASHESTGSSNTTWSNRDKYSQLLDNLKIMDKAKWVKCRDPCFADKEIRELAESFMVCTKTSVLGFHEYYMNIMNGDDMYPDELKLLIAAANTIIISTAECERAFSNMNNIISTIRSSTLLKTASSLMFISSVGPPLSAFDAEYYVKQWLKKGH
ncbi:uncharacterized protein LOC111873863 isoform X2 [Cryptotermes secundus]|uniref:uncharacterized protein LOC111873863 isoform X2 n=1 Tax=Cryptotermes secundus TaxID=105785 RepID=UPI000CD7B4E2|nr:uncharacterized protein LOC111873863 isoform X2 [Cryptotermes secundus]